MQQGIELLGFYAQNRFFFGDHAFVHQINGDLQRGSRGALAVAGLQHVQLLIFDGEFHILHIAIVLFQVRRDGLELFVDLRHILCELRDRAGGTDAGDDVLALRIDQVFAEQRLCAGGGIAGERNARAGYVVQVAEYHGHYVNGGAPRIGDIVHAAIYVRAGIIPGAEYGLDGFHHLRLGIGGEIFALFFLVEFLETLYQQLHIFGVQIDVLSDALGFLHFIDDHFEALLGKLHNNVGEHLDETTIGIVYEAFELRIGVARDQTRGNFIVHAQIQNGVHHARHGSASTGTHGYEERVLHVAEFLAVDFFHLGKCDIDLLKNIIADCAAVIIVTGASFGGDGEALGYGHAQRGHFRQISALAAEQVSHGSVAFTEQIYILLCHFVPPTRLKSFLYENI